MTTVLENYIADSMEESMQPYIDSEEYQSSKDAINTKIVNFRSGLNPAQQKEFNLLMDMINDADAEFSAKAFVIGAVNGIALREQVIRP